MMQLLLAASFLPLSHFGLASSRLRDVLVRRVGEVRYLRLYSLVTLTAFAWLIAAYRRAPIRVLWTTAAWMKLGALPIVLASFVLVVAGVTTPNPTVVGAEKLFDNRDIVRGILRVTRNPFLWGVGLWALTHVICIGDAAGLVTFGAIGALGLVGAPVLDAKKAKRHGARWDKFAAATSSIPFLAIARRRQRFVPSEIGACRVALALALFCLVFYAHRWAFGVPPLPGK
jgi:uncharacterized membrane protein